MGCRAGMYTIISGQKDKRKVRRVDYTGMAKMNMESYLDIGGVIAQYQLIDICEIDAQVCLAVNLAIGL